jgi:guanosine-diphosphatase
MPPGKHVYTLNFNKNTHILYQQSYDGYGLMQMRRKVTETSKPNDAPCISLGKSRKRENGEVIDGTGVSFEACESVFKKQFYKSECLLSPCSFDGVYMPKIDAEMELYAFSYFYDICNYNI